MNATVVSNLQNPSVAFDGTVMTTLLTELLNADGKTKIEIPTFRLKEILALAVRPPHIGSELKMCETICAFYCLCLYYSLTSIFDVPTLMEFISLAEGVICESQVVLQSCGPYYIVMTDLFTTLQRDESLETEHKLEPFQEPHSISQTFGRYMLTRLRTVMRNQRANNTKAKYDPLKLDSQSSKKQEPDPTLDCLLPQSLYLLASFALCHIAINIHSVGHINLIPGVAETVLLVALTKSAVSIVGEFNPETRAGTALSTASGPPDTATAATTSDKSNNGKSSPKSAKGKRDKSPAKNAAAAPLTKGSSTKKLTGNSGTATTARTGSAIVESKQPTPATPGTMALNAKQTRELQQQKQFNRVIHVAQQLALFVAHVILDERILQEIRLVRGKLVRSFNHPDVIVAQFHTSNVKNVLQSGTMNNSSSSGGGGGGLGNRHVMSPVKGLDLALPNKSSSNSCNKIDITEPGFHFVNRAAEAIPFAFKVNPTENNVDDFQVIPERPFQPAQVGFTSQGSLATDRSGASDSRFSLTSSSVTKSVSVMGSLKSQPPLNSKSNDNNQTSNSNSAANQNRSKVNTAATSTASSLEHKLKLYWNPQIKPYRLAFLVFDGLMKSRPHGGSCPSFASQLTSEYTSPPSNTVMTLAQCLSITDLMLTEGLTQHPMTEAIKFIEGQHFHFSDAFYFPRTVNPCEDIYWIMSSIMEFLHKETVVGRGLCPSSGDIVKHLRQQIKTVKKEKPRVSTVTTATLNTALAAVKKKGKDKLPETETIRFVSLADKLNKAVKEASLETRLLTLEQRREDERRAATVAAINAAMGIVDLAESGSVDEAGSTTDLSDVHKFLQESVSEAASVSSAAAAALKKQNLSVVWTCPPKVWYKAKQNFEGYDFDLERQKQNPLYGLPTKQQSKEFAKKLEDERKAEAEKKEKERLLLEDQKETIIANARTYKALTLNTLRNKIKDDMQAKQAFKSMWEDEMRAEEVRKANKAKQDKHDKEEAEFREIMRINELKVYKQMAEEQEKEQHKSELSYEMMKINEMADRQEAQEIIRRAQEEARMKYLEERRRVIEDRLEAQRLEEKRKKDAKTAAVGKIRDEFQARIRRGNFMYAEGKLDFYEDVQKAPLPWIQYEDADHKPYWYDPRNNTTQYRMPVDAPIRHWTEVEREKYDAIHGEGAYDQLMAERAQMDYINANGGYFTEAGEWVQVNGYYDSEYNYHAYEGYVNEQGKYIRYAKAAGNLSFMV